MKGTVANSIRSVFEGECNGRAMDDDYDREIAIDTICRKLRPLFIRAIREAHVTIVDNDLIDEQSEKYLRKFVKEVIGT